MTAYPGTGRRPPDRTRLTRAGLAAAGGGCAAYGLLRLLSLGWGNLVATAGWAAGAVLAHDVLIAGATLLAGAFGRAVLAPRWRAPAAAGLIVLGSLTLVAVPVLGRFGAKADNPSLLDRNYAAGWAVLAALVVVGVLVAGVRDKQSEE